VGEVPSDVEESRYFDPAMETMPRPEIEALQRSLLTEALPYVDEHSPLLAEHWARSGVKVDEIRSVRELTENVPFMDKDTIRAYRDGHGDPLGGMGLMAESAVISSTTGTTGDPVLLPSRREGMSEAARIAADFWEMGCRPGDAFVVMLFTFRGAPMLTPHAFGASTVLFDHAPAELERLCRVSLDLRPTGLYLLSGPLILALRQMEPSLPFDLGEVFSSYRGVVYAGEPMGSRTREALDRWGIEHFNHTAVGDVDSATECGEHDGHHCHDDQALIEVLDPEGDEPVPEGEVGELVVTTLNPRLTNMLVRYRSEDLLRTSTEPCGCGRTHTRMWPVGRKGDEVVIEGRSILPVDVWLAVESIEATSAGLFQVIRVGREMDRLRLRVGYDEGATTASLAAVRTDVIDSVTGAVGVVPDVELVANSELLKLGPPHKIPRVAAS
jgi:phenylacetate-CoA ligase